MKITLPFVVAKFLPISNSPALDYKKSDKKEEVMKTLYNLLFKKNDAIVINKLAKKVDKQYKESAAPIVVGSTVKLKKNYQVGEVIGFKGKRAIVKVGQLPMNIDIEDLLVVEKIEEVEVPKIGISRNKTVVSKTPINKNIKK